jgi:signal transduction histidine kinase
MNLMRIANMAGLNIGQSKSAFFLSASSSGSGTSPWRGLTPDLPRIRGDTNQLEQVFVNLIANSRDAVTEAREKAAAVGWEIPPGGTTMWLLLPAT